MFLPFPQNLPILMFYHVSVISDEWNVICIAVVSGCNEAAEKDMKIYLLMMLIGALLTAVHFTSAPEKRPETLPQ
jgi:hypothetical protein